MFYNFRNFCININHIIRVTKFFEKEIEIEYYTVNAIHHQTVYYNTEEERDFAYNCFVNEMKGR